MQFYLDGYKPGDPRVAAPHPSVAERAPGLPAEVDVLIVGAGPGRARARRAAGRVADTDEGLSEFPHVIVNQARMLAYLLDHMARSPSRLVPSYGFEVTGVEVGAPEDPVTVTLRGPGGGVEDPGAVRRRLRRRRSRIRAAIGRELVGDVTDESWGVMDVLAVTDFPDTDILPPDGHDALVEFFAAHSAAGSAKSSRIASK